MINHYPAWKNLLVIAVMVVGIFLALPNVFGEDPAVQISQKNSPAVSQQAISKVKRTLARHQLPYKSISTNDGHALVRFDNTNVQLKAVGAIKKALGDQYVAALNLAPSTPGWLQSAGLKPMSKGLDMRGGVYFLLQVDIPAAINQQMQHYRGEVRSLLRQKHIRYTEVARNGQKLAMTFRTPADRSQAQSVLSSQYPELTFTSTSAGGHPQLIAQLSDQKIRSIKNFAVEQNITTLRNRVNQLGVAEPIIQRQGANRIVVELPGVQDTTRAKNILGEQATLQFHLVDPNTSAAMAQQTGHVPLGDMLVKDRQGQPVLLKRDVIVTGDQLTDATSGFDQQSGTPDVNVTLNSAGARRMGATPRANLNKPMGVLFIETETKTHKIDGKTVRTHHKKKTVINVATIQGIFSNRFQITGLGRQEARNLALLLRAGALAAPMDYVAERTVGPSLGQANINQGFEAVGLGFILVVVFVAFYYKTFGLVADLALLMNVILIVAVLSIIQATLTLPGIAGILLTVGMAIDANVLIYERIREELRNGNTPQAAIHAGYERAFGTIADANITTLIAGLMLFLFGSGPVKGFAITLTLGILTSLFTAIMGTRSVVNWLYGGRRLARLSV